MKTIKALLLDPATGRYEEIVLEGRDDSAIEVAIKGILGARHVVPLSFQAAVGDMPEVVAWSDLEARMKEQTCCWTRAEGTLGVPGRAVFTGVVGRTVVDVPVDRYTLAEAITTFVAILEFPRPGPEPVFETTFWSSMKVTRQG